MSHDSSFMHVTLLWQYKDLWNLMKATAEKRAADHAVRAAASEERQQRDRERRARMALRGPKVRSDKLVD